MERINQFEFYQLGETLQQLKQFHNSDNLVANDVFFPIWQGANAIGELCDGNPMELTVTQASALKLRDALGAIVEKHFRQPTDGGGTAWKFPTTETPPIPSWEWSTAKQALTDFETIFREEMGQAAIYRVPRRGIYDIGHLIDSADNTFPAELLDAVPAKSRDDWRAAGRCLAFSLLTASGFHVARAVEGAMEAYYRAATGKDDTLRGWDAYLKAFEKAREGDSPKGRLVPTEKVISELRQMKDDYRNPIAHPRVVLSDPDARMLFANGESVIIAMAQELKAVAKPPTLNALSGLEEGG